jgi:hypothetical protein
VETSQRSPAAASPAWSKPSRQTSSECCLSSGDRRVEAYTARKAGREGSAPKSFTIAMPTSLRQRKAASRQPIMRGCFGVAGVASPGHAFKRTSRQPRRAADLSRQGTGSAQPKKNQVPREMRVSHGKRTDPRRGERARADHQPFAHQRVSSLRARRVVRARREASPPRQGV